MINRWWTRNLTLTGREAQIIIPPGLLGKPRNAGDQYGSISCGMKSELESPVAFPSLFLQAGILKKSSVRESQGDIVLEAFSRFPWKTLKDLYVACLFYSTSLEVRCQVLSGST